MDARRRRSTSTRRAAARPAPATPPDALPAWLAAVPVCAGGEKADGPTSALSSPARSSEPPMPQQADPTPGPCVDLAALAASAAAAAIAAVTAAATPPEGCPAAVTAPRTTAAAPSPLCPPHHQGRPPTRRPLCFGAAAAAGAGTAATPPAKRPRSSSAASVATTAAALPPPPPPLPPPPATSTSTSTARPPPAGPPTTVAWRRLDLPRSATIAGGGTPAPRWGAALARLPRQAAAAGCVAGGGASSPGPATVNPPSLALVGGWDAAGAPLDDTWLLRLGRGPGGPRSAARWTPGPSLPDEGGEDGARGGPAAAPASTVDGDRLVVYGGAGGRGGALASPAMLDAAAGLFIRLPLRGGGGGGARKPSPHPLPPSPLARPTPPPPRAGASLTRLPDGRALAFGGADDAGKLTNDAFILDAGRLAWVPLAGIVRGPPPKPRAGHIAALVGPPGAERLVVLGGTGRTGRPFLLKEVHALHIPSWTWREHSADVVGDAPEVCFGGGEDGRPAHHHLPPSPAVGVAVGPASRHVLVVAGRDPHNPGTAGVAVLDAERWVWSRPAVVGAGDAGPPPLVGAAAAPLPPAPPPPSPRPGSASLMARWAAAVGAAAAPSADGLVLVGGRALGGGGAEPGACSGDAWVLEVGWG